MSAFENSWEALDKARNPANYETVTTAEGKEVTFLKGQEAGAKEAGQRFTKEEEENIARAAAQMQDRDD